MPVTDQYGYYSFLPYLRQGLATQLTTKDIYGNLDGSPNRKRDNFNLNLTVEKTHLDGSTVSPLITQSVDVKGPGDITGINDDAILKVHPADWVTNFEPNYLPYIEFYDEDFPWRYTPAKVKLDTGGYGFRYRIRPWVTLVVLKETEFVNEPFNGILPVITITLPASQLFPPQGELWAWAHVHINGNLAPGDAAIALNATAMQNAVNSLKNILDTNPDKAVSRIISPRRLETNTAYHAFLIPTFEGGRLAGLGKDTAFKMLDPAWDEDTPSDTKYPVYKSWYFKTGGAGDFESLVRLLQPRIMDDSVGKRQMDLQMSNNPLLEAVPPPGATGTIGLQGVIQPTDAVDDPWSLNSAYAQEMAELLNAPADIIGQVDNDDPVIAPPIYGCWHAAENTVAPTTSAGDWLQEINLDPRYRVFAGAGTETLRRNQDKYMEIAWQQVGEVMKANQKLRMLQLTKQANRALYEKHLYKLNDELLLDISAPAHNRIKAETASQTVYKQVADSAIPVTMLSAAFRRLTRPGGFLVSALEISSGTAVSTQQMISSVNSGLVQPTTPVQAPVGQFAYTVWQPSQLTPQFTLSLPANATFTPSNPGVVTSTPAPGPNAPVTQVMVNAVAELHALITAMPGYVFNVNDSLDIGGAREEILAVTNPVSNTVAFANKSIRIKKLADNSFTDLLDLNKVLAAPKIRTPMFEELARLSPEWVMPGLNNVGNNTICILKTDRKYLEAYMVGLNHAMAGELLWRGYPTDQRGTVFSFFWEYNDSTGDVAYLPQNDQIAKLDEYRDIQDIHRWRTTPGNPSSGLTNLGENNARIAMLPPVPPEMLVLVIRGELLRKYPGAVIYLQEAEWQQTGGSPDINKPRKLKTNSNPVYPAFSSKVDPDIYLLGFAGLTASKVRGGGIADTSKPGYFVIFQEKAGEIRFGADEVDPDKIPYAQDIEDWNALNWANLKDNPTEDGFIDTTKTITIQTQANDPDFQKHVLWNENAATVAYVLRQSPVKLEVHAEGLIPE